MELNLSYECRESLLSALHRTTHPSAFHEVKTLIQSFLQFQARQNFVRWTICNGNQPRVFFLRTFAISCILTGCIIAVALTMNNVSRWWRLWAWPPWWFGTVNLIAAAKGLCVLLYRQNVREVRPWELMPEHATLLLRETALSKTFPRTDVGRQYVNAM
jgi:hypothetical protein